MIQKNYSLHASFEAQSINILQSISELSHISYSNSKLHNKEARKKHTHGSRNIEPNIQLLRRVDLHWHAPTILPAPSQLQMPGQVPAISHLLNPLLSTKQTEQGHKKGWQKSIILTSICVCLVHRNFTSMQDLKHCLIL